MSDKGREEFQAWWEDWFGEAPMSGWDALWCGDGYNAEDIDHMWDAWQASRASIEVELPSKTFILSTDGDSLASMYIKGREDCANSIRAAGLKVKGDMVDEYRCPHCGGTGWSANCDKCIPY